MQILIDIPNKIYKAICNKNALGCDIDDIKNIIRNGIPLPKGHGRLKDVDNIFSYSEDLYEAIDLAPTIIEADKR